MSIKLPVCPWVPCSAPALRQVVIVPLKCLRHAHTRAVELGPSQEHNPATRISRENCACIYEELSKQVRPRGLACKRLLKAYSTMLS